MNQHFNTCVKQAQDSAEMTLSYQLPLSLSSEDSGQRAPSYPKLGGALVGHPTFLLGTVPYSMGAPLFGLHTDTCLEPSHHWTFPISAGLPAWNPVPMTQKNSIQPQESATQQSNQAVACPGSFSWSNPCSLGSRLPRNMLIFNPWYMTTES